MTQTTKNGVEPSPDPAALSTEPLPSSTRRGYTRPTIAVERITSLVLSGGASVRRDNRTNTAKPGEP
jgi:hypothetical protein